MLPFIQWLTSLSNTSELSGLTMAELWVSRSLLYRSCILRACGAQA